MTKPMVGVGQIFILDSLNQPAKIAEQYNTPDRKGRLFSDSAKFGVSRSLSELPVTLRQVITALASINVV